METRVGEFKQVDESLVPEWTCPDCLSKKPQRDPETIHTINELQKALFEDFQLQPQQQLAELNLSGWNELAITPAEAYREVAAVR